jgi:predicted dinucleotide-binding enzyme
MRIGILGTGVVGATIGSRLIGLGHEVMMGSRTATNEKATQWASAAGGNARHGTFADAADFGEIVFNCTSGIGSLEALALAGEASMAGKILIDVSNPLDFSEGFPPSLTVSNRDSLGERIQAALPQTKVVKALNTMTAAVMVDPSIVPGDHNVFICGNDAGAKERVRALLGEFGWKSASFIDLGDITNARGPEMMLPVWVRLYGALGTPLFNFAIVRGAAPAAG